MLFAYIMISLFVSVILECFASQDKRVFEILEMRTIIINKLHIEQNKQSKKTQSLCYGLPIIIIKMNILI